jgi:hypothetical protein
MSRSNNDQRIYEFVREKLIGHGVDRSDKGLLTLNDKKLFSLFVNLERSARSVNFDAVREAVGEIEVYLASIEKRELLAFAYLFLRFRDFTPKRVLADEFLPNGMVRKIREYHRQVSDEEILIGLWATVKFEEMGERLLRVVYSEQ